MAVHGGRMARGLFVANVFLTHCGVLVHLVRQQRSQWRRLKSRWWALRRRRLSSDGCLDRVASNTSSLSITWSERLSDQADTGVTSQVYSDELSSLIPVKPKRRWATPTGAYAVIDAHRLVSSAVRSNDDSDRPVHSSTLSLHELRDLSLRRLTSTVAWSMTVGRVHGVTERQLRQKDHYTNKHLVTYRVMAISCLHERLRAAYHDILRLSIYI